MQRDRAARRDGAVQRLLANPVFPPLKELVIGFTGLAYWSDKDVRLAEVLAPVIEAGGLGVAETVRRLAAERGHGPVTDAVVAAVTVGETFFQRYREQFEALRGIILPACLRRPAGTLSIWSAGCSIGAEPYSIAMTLHGALPPGWRLHILATDVNASALATARAGLYGAWAVRDLPEPDRTGCFVRVGNQWRVLDVYREEVVFRRHNLVTDPAPAGLAAQGRFDVVFCRNVLMYFDAATRGRVLDKLHDSLAEGGWLVVGHAEAGPEVAGRFQAVAAPGCTLYRRPDRPAQPAMPHLRAQPAMPHLRAMGRRPSGPPPASVRPRDLPSAPPAAYPAGMVRRLLDAGQYSTAERAARAWVAQAPGDAAAHYHLGLALEHLAPGKAVTAFRAAVDLEPGLSLGHFHLMRLLSGDEAERHRRAAMASLAGRDGTHPVAFGDGLTVAELASVVRRLHGEERR